MKRFFITLFLTLFVLNLFAWQTYNVADSSGNITKKVAETTDNLGGSIKIVSNKLYNVPIIQFSGTTFFDEITDIEIVFYCGAKWQYKRLLQDCQLLNSTTYHTFFPIDLEFADKFYQATLIEVNVYQNNKIAFTYFTRVKNGIDVLVFFNIFDIITTHGRLNEKANPNPPYVDRNIVDECEDFRIYNLRKNKNNTIDIYYSDGWGIYEKASTTREFIDLSIMRAGDYSIIVNNCDTIDITVNKVLTGYNLE